MCALAILAWAGPALGAALPENFYFNDLGSDHLWMTPDNWLSSDLPITLGPPQDYSNPGGDNAWVGDGLTCELRSTTIVATPKRMKIGTAGGAGIVEIHTGATLNLNLGTSGWFGCGATGDGYGDGTLRMLGGTIMNCGLTVGGTNQTGTIDLQSGTIDAVSGGVCGASIGGGGYNASGKVGTVTQTGGTFNLRSVVYNAYLNVGGNEYYRGNIHDCTGLYTISGGTLNQYGDAPDGGGDVDTTAGMILGTKAYSGDYVCTGNTGTLNVKGAWEASVDNVKLNALRMYREGDGNDAILIYDIIDDGIEKVVVANDVRFAGKLVITTNPGLNESHYVLMTYNSRNSTAFDEIDLSALPAGWSIEYDKGAGNNELWLVPEPATMLLLGLGGIGVLIRRKRR